MKHDPMASAGATAVTIAIIYVVCALAFTLIPGLSMTVAQSWFHGIELSPIADWRLSFGSVILGLVTSTIGGWLVGYIFAKAYNYFFKA